jgi:glycosyltransferase involved in cell wall biosynthesis
MLTVVMATRNRAQILQDVLETYCHLEQPGSGWKLVIADNGSTDQTPQVLASFASRLPLHAVCEPKLGKNNALNTGLAWLEGDLTVFTDDDAFPHEDWLLQLRNAADTLPAYSMFGGAVVPRWEVSPPPWIRWVEIGPAFGMNNPSLEDGPMLSGRLYDIIGPNMAIRTQILRSGVRFDSSIGPRGSSYPMGSETELILRLASQGYKAWHVHGAVVEHLVRAEQLEKAWIMKRAVCFGRGRRRWWPNPRLWMGLPRHLFRDIPKEGLKIAAAWVSFRREALFRSRWRFNTLLGEAIEARTLARERCAVAGSLRALL